MRQFLIILLLAVACPAVALAQSQSDEDKGYLTNLIEENLSGEGRTVSISGFEGAFSSAAKIAQLTISDADGVWLSLDNVILEWNRSALLRGAIDIAQLQAARVVLARPPLPVDNALPTPEATPFALPELPVSLRLETLQIERIEIGAAFLGQELAFALRGSADLSGGTAQADIVADRLDGKAGRFAIKTGFNNTDRVLALDMSLEEGAGGVVAGLLDLPGAPSVALQLAGDAPLDSFGATLNIATDGAPRVTGAFAMAQVDDRLGLQLDIGGDVTALFAPEYRTFFGEDVQLVATGAQTPDGGFQLQALDLTGQSLRLQGSALIDGMGWPVQASLTGAVLDAGGDIVLLPLAGEKTYVDRIDLNIGFDRRIADDWSAEFVIAGFDRPGLLIRDLTLTGGGLLQKGTDGVGDAQITAALQYAARGVQLDDAGAAEALGDTISGQMDVYWASGQPTRIDRLTLTGPGLTLLADATIAGPSEDLRTRSNLLFEVAALDRFSTLAGRALEGAAAITVLADITPLSGGFDVIASGETADLAIGVPQADAYLFGEGALSARVVRDGAGLRLDALQLATPMAQVKAEGALTSDGGQARFDAALTDVAPLIAGVSGAARVDGTVAISAAQVVDFDITASGPAVDLTASGAVSPTKDGQTINLTAQVAARDLALYNPVTGLDAAGGATAQVSGTALGDGTRFHAILDLATQDVRIGDPRVDALLAGAGTVTAKISRLGQDRFWLRDLKVATPALSLSGTARGGLQGAAMADLRAELRDSGALASGLTGPVTLTLDATRGPDDVAQVALRATGSGTDIAADAQIAAPEDQYAVEGTLVADVADLAAFQALAGQRISGQLRTDVSGRIVPDLSDFDLRANVQSRNLAVGIAQVDQLLRGVGRFSAEASQGPEGLVVRNVSLETSELSINGQLDGAAGVGQGRFDARLRDVGLFTDALRGPVTASGRADRRTSGWGIDVIATGPGGMNAAVRGQVDDDMRLDLDVDGAAPLGLANTLLAPRRIDGDVKFDLAVNGPAALEAVSGNVTVTGARLSAPTLGQVIEDINATIRLNNAQAQLDVSAAPEAGGVVTIDGPVALTAPFAGNLTARAVGVILRDPTLFETSVNGQVTMDGPMAGGARIAGALTLGATEIQVPSSGVGALGTLPEVQHLGASSAVQRTLSRADALPKPGGQEATASGPAYPLNITINAPSRIFVRGRGLDAELGGSLNITGNTNNVIPVGEFALVRGRLDILQQRFELTEGAAYLQGDFVPYIRLVAATEAATGTRIEIIVEGPAGSPEVSFQSSPELPQDEVLSQLIFGRDLADISPLQAVQLAAAVGTLAGRGGGGIIDNFRQGVGLDDFDITTDEAGNAALRAGKYLTENVYTDVTVSSTGQTDININLDVTDNVTAKGTVGTDGETSVGIFYERDY